MAILIVAQSSLAGVDPAFASAAGGGDSFPNTGKEMLIVRNADVSDKTVTADSPGTCDLGATAHAAHDVAAVTVPATGFRMFGPFPTKRFNDSNGRVQLTYSAVTNVTVAVVTMGHAQ